MRSGWRALPCCCAVVTDGRLGSPALLRLTRRLSRMRPCCHARFCFPCHGHLMSGWLQEPLWRAAPVVVVAVLAAALALRLRWTVHLQTP